MSKKNRIKRESREVILQTLKDKYMRLYAPTQFQSGIAFPPERVLDDTVEVPLELPAGYYEADEFQSESRFIREGLFNAQRKVYEDDPLFIRTGGPDARHMVIDVTAELIEPNKQTSRNKSLRRMITRKT
jgi:hypothetical protein